MFALLRPLTRAVTYTRGLHLCLPLAVVAIWLFIDSGRLYVPALLIIPVGLLPAARLAEGIQAQLFLTPGERGRPDASITAASATTWADRWRTVWWMELRLVCSVVQLAVIVGTVWSCTDLIRAAAGAAPSRDALIHLAPHRLWALMVPVPVAVALAVLVGLGEFVTAAARRLLGPSVAERLHVLEQRTEQLLEHNRIARELHDSIGHALTAIVLQAGAARAIDDPEFTGRALDAVENSGRAAMDDLDRVLRVLRTPGPPTDERPTLAAAAHLIDSARSTGAPMEVVVEGPIDALPGPITREGYRILQESLTNALRHCGPVPIQVSVRADTKQLKLEVRNPLPEPPAASGAGSGLRGIRERAELLGGRAQFGPDGNAWLVRVEVPLR
ncbi:two-component sensor histidine kinase [Nocardia yunnanensis]|uniref:histidine kinase n=1 Tax=Nocardia yunnanensis TaxID=2382165 RepID=A0A386ZB09_9NOCA|nr:histidine kinase [Nocardia yunnanensis]AYF73805.1 two-component sensor histidine kinase [Nocardia yunnanensis]